MPDSLPTPSGKTPILKLADLALWRLPRAVRKVVVAPVALLCGIAEAWSSGASEFRYGWDTIMEAVEVRPENRPPDPSEGRGAGGAS
jgi:hypothetical protein